MKEPLFEAFDPISAAAWKQKIQADLKGADYQELLWKTEEGITVKPFYTKEDSNAFSQKETYDFSIAERFYVNDIAKTKNAIHKALKGGVNAIILQADKPFAINELLKDICTEYPNIEIHFDLHFLDLAFYKKIKNNLKGKIYFLNIDIIGHLTKDGNWQHSMPKDFAIVKEILSDTTDSFVLAVDAAHYQNAGAIGVQQIAYALAHANEYLEAFGVSRIKNIQFIFATGSNYFFEIAKLKAFQEVWTKLTEAHGITVNTKILCTPSRRNKSLYDYNVNLLRSTTECMSAILGGASCIENLAYDALYHKKNDFGSRIAKNQLLILQKESYFENASSFADGAYYIESISQQMAQKSLDIFKNIEQAGGFLKQLKDGIIQKKLAESASKEQEAFDKGEIILLGTNKYPNPEDKMKDALELYPFLKKQPRKTIIKPILATRIAEKIEQERLNQE